MREEDERLLKEEEEAIRLAEEEERRLAEEAAGVKKDHEPTPAAAAPVTVRS